MNKVKIKIRRKYNSEGNTYGVSNKYLYHRWSWNRVSQKMLNLLFFGAKIKGKKLLNEILLDAGCGNGRWSQLYAGLGLQVIGVDFAPNMMKAAIKRAIIHSYAEKFSGLLADLEYLPFKDSIFDYICLYGVMEHLPNPEKVIIALSKLLKSGGFLLIDVPISLGFSHLTLRLFGYHPYYRFFHNNYIEKLVSEVKCLKIERKEPTIYIWTCGLVNWIITFIVERLNVRILDKLDKFIQHVYKIPCGMLYLIRKIPT
jgi:SAM-dependent methyltransferase